MANTIYKVISAPTTQELSTKVTRALNLGYYAMGSLVVDADEGLYHQAVIRHEELPAFLN